MDKLKMMSMDKVQGNIEKIQKMFPNAVTEVLRDGKPELKVDFDVLKQELADTLIDDRELRYQFTWPDKQKSVLLANTPIDKTLRPCKEESVDFDNTQNLYIEGDNLEVLKLLQETYLGKIKMIYIDPPYNTGNDFVYNDDFSQEAGEYLEGSGQFDEQGNRLFQNTESNGRFHTDWLNMIYPRLRLAKDLLADDGVIFISIDERELVNLKKICNEIFSDVNLCETLIWKNKFGSGAMTKGFIGVHEYILVYSKSSVDNITRPLTQNEKDTYNKTKDEKFATRGGYVTQPLAVTTFGDRPNLRYPVYYKGQEIWPNKQWVWEKTRMQRAIENNEVVFNLQSDGTYNLRSKKYLIDENGNERRGKPTSFITDIFTQNGTEDIRKIFGKILFDYTKPVDLIKYLLSFEINDKCDKDFIVLDFFSGSATTAHAVMQLNAEDGGNRKFIMVQLPEPCDEKSEAYKAGYKNICEIGKERIRRAGKKILAEHKAQSLINSINIVDETHVSLERPFEEIMSDDSLQRRLDIGFRVLKLDISNMQPVYYNPEEYNQTMLYGLTDNIKADRTPLDLLFQVMLDLGKPLSAKIEEKDIAGKKVYIINDDDLIACFDSNVTEETVKAIAQLKPLYAVFRDSSLSSDSTAANFDQIFATYSPNTIRKVL